MILFSKKINVPLIGKNASDYAVGESVFIPVNGTDTEFIVVHQGLPSSLYDSSCNGTWLMMKDLYEKQIWHNYEDAAENSANNYANSDIHAYLNGTFIGLLNNSTKSSIVQVKIPYRQGTGSGGSTKSGSDGLSTKIFLLSGYEVGLTNSNYSYHPVDGAKLSYFTSGMNTSANDKRIAYYNGTAEAWWLRSVPTDSTYIAIAISNKGAIATYYTARNTLGIRPTFVISSTTKFDPETNRIAG